jgi:hypothetical protein
MTKEEIRAESKAMLEDPSTWPSDILAMKRYLQTGGFPECGFIEKSERLTIVIGNMFGIVGGDSGIEGEKTYTSYDAMLDDGWEVD